MLVGAWWILWDGGVMVVSRGLMVSVVGGLRGGQGSVVRDN